MKAPKLAALPPAEPWMRFQPSPELSEAMEQLFEEQRRGADPKIVEQIKHRVAALNAVEIASHEDRYPSKAPGPNCRHARLVGLLVDNAPGWLPEGACVELMTIGPETLCAWRPPTEGSKEPTRSRHGWLMSAFASNADGTTGWRPALSLLHHALRFSALYEDSFLDWRELDYAWIYSFDPSISAEEQAVSEPYASDHARTALEGGSVIWPWRIAWLTPAIRLLETDERFYTACQYLHASVDTYYTCLTCVLSPRKKHSHEEPSWVRLSLEIPAIEAAIVQATKAVEALVGQPSKNVARTQERWNSAFASDWTVDFGPAGRSFRDVYTDFIYAKRDEAAHSRHGQLDFTQTRRDCAVIQAFAYHLLFQYAEQRLEPHARALQELNFNPTLEQHYRHEWPGK